MRDDSFRILSPSDGGPAFPVKNFPTADGGQFYARGITIRDYFAAQAMAALISADDEIDYAQAALLAYGHADAMLAERAKAQP